MTTIAAEPLSVPAARQHERLYVRTAVACLAVVVIGFLPTYWVPIARGRLDVAPLTHVHAFLLYSWMLLFIRQTSLVASGNTARHKEWGVLGVALATAMTLVGLGITITSLKDREAAGLGASARAFSTVPVTGILLFAALFAIAVLNTKRPEIHKRLMLVANASLLQPAIGRLFGFVLAPPPPAGALASPPVAFTILPGILSNIPIVIAMIHDRRTRGRVNPVYWIAGGSLLAVQVLRVPLSSTSMWDQVTRWLVALSP